MQCANHVVINVILAKLQLLIVLPVHFLSPKELLLNNATVLITILMFKIMVNAFNVMMKATSLFYFKIFSMLGELLKINA